MSDGRRIKLSCGVAAVAAQLPNQGNFIFATDQKLDTISLVH
jgi:hypothetical protein